MKRNIIAKSARTPDSRLREQMLPFSLLAAAQPQVEQLKSGCLAWSRMTILLTPPPLCFMPHRSLNNPDKKSVITRSSPCQFPLRPSQISKNKIQNPKSKMLDRCSPNDLLSKLVWSAMQGWPTLSQVKWGTFYPFLSQYHVTHQCHHLPARILTIWSTKNQSFSPKTLAFDVSYSTRLFCQVATGSAPFPFIHQIPLSMKPPQWF